MAEPAKQPETEETRRKSNEALEGSARSVFSRTVGMAILGLIILNVLAVILETVPSLARRYGPWFHGFEIFSVVLFTIEYVARLWSVTSDRRFHHPIWGRLRWAVTPLALIDLLAVLPFYLPFVIHVDLRFIRALRLIRLFRIFKIRRYSHSLDIVLTAFRNTRNDLILAAAAIALMLVSASAILYYIERGSGLVEFSSIPHTMGWVVALLTPNIGTTVTPSTPAGKVVGTAIAILGFGIWALPAGILATGIGQAMRRHEKQLERCPHCGRSLRDETDVTQPKSAKKG